MPCVIKQLSWPCWTSWTGWPWRFSAVCLFFKQYNSICDNGKSSCYNIFRKNDWLDGCKWWSISQQSNHYTNYGSI